MRAGVSGDTGNRVLRAARVKVSADTPPIIASLRRSVRIVLLTLKREGNVLEKFTFMQSEIEQRPYLLRLGALFSETILVQIDDDEFYLTFDKGHLTDVTQGISRKTPWTFAVRTDSEALAEFWTARPKPGFHDLFGLVKMGRGRIDGNILTLVKNLRFFKDVMALPRTQEAAQ